MVIILNKDTDIFKWKFQQPYSTALVIPVNGLGVAGKGLAKQFKDKYPNWYEDYRQQCKASKDLYNGKPSLYLEPSIRQYFINFPTKQNWQNNSQLDFIELGLRNLVESVEPLSELFEIVFPAIGCGLGRLKFEDVRNKIEAVFEDSILDVYLIPPK
jgi:hypothetical protein